MTDILNQLEQKINTYLQFAETKNAAIITFNSALLFFSIDFFINTYKGTYTQAYILCIIILVISLLVSLMSFLPRLKNKKLIQKIMFSQNKKNKSQKTNLLDYEVISKYNATELMNQYEKALDLKSTNPMFDLYLTRQVIDLAQTAYLKYSFFRLTLNISIISIIALVLLAIIG